MLRQMKRLTISILILAAATALHAQQSNTADVESGDFAISARTDAAESFHVRRKSTGESFPIAIPDDVHHVEALFSGSPQNRVLALAAHNNFGHSTLMLVVDPNQRTVVDELFGGLFSISPDNRFVTFFQWQPSHYDNGTSSLLFAYDVAASSFENHITRDQVGVPVYPPNMLNSHVPENQRHEFSGATAWLASGVFAFGDTFQNKTSLVVLDFRRGLHNVVSYVRPINNLSYYPSVCANLPSFGVTGIRRSEDGSGVTVDLAYGATHCDNVGISVPGLVLP
jgi:hypothetical protein